MFGIMQNYLQFPEFLHIYECVLLPTNSNIFQPLHKICNYRPHISRSNVYWRCYT